MTTSCFAKSFASAKLGKQQVKDEILTKCQYTTLSFSTFTPEVYLASNVPVCQIH